MSVSERHREAPLGTPEGVDDVTLHTFQVIFYVFYALRWGPRRHFLFRDGGLADEKLQRGPHRRASENVTYHLNSVQSYIVHGLRGPQVCFSVTPAHVRRVRLRFRTSADP